ncbi:kinase-like domain-containing protein [Rhizophagus clarus]|nr:kinase-like domain-containing protein [Rhizophagus clarus]
MEYADNGNLRGCLTEVTNKWKHKLYILYSIIAGLDKLHKEGLIHYNFHDGNILCRKYVDEYVAYISDYLYPYQFTKFKENICGVIPFMAPEVLRGEPCTSASNIYSFSMVMWELISGTSPFNDRAHDFQLALNICKGERPEITENTPQFYIDLMEKCWDDDPSKRPSTSEVLDIIEKWVILPNTIRIKDIDKKLKRNIMEFINAPVECSNIITKSHPRACYTSRLLDFTSEELNEILEGPRALKFFELKFFESRQKEKDAKIELVDLQQKNSQFEQDNQSLRLDLAKQIKKECTLQSEIIYLQNEIYEKQVLNSNLIEQLEQNSQQTQTQIDQLKQEKSNLQEKLSQTEANIEELKLQLIEQKDKCEQIGQEKIDLHIEMVGLLQDQKFNTKLKAKYTKEIGQLKQKLINEEQIKTQLTQAIQIKDDRLNELEQKLIILNNKKELGELEKKPVIGENTKSIHNMNQKEQNPNMSKVIKELQQRFNNLESSLTSTNSKKGNRTHFCMMAEELNLLRKDLDRLELRLKQEENELKNLAAD